VRTVKIGAIGVDGRDFGDRGIEGRGQCRFVGDLFETLHRNQQPPGVFSLVAGPYLHCIDPCFTLGHGNGPPLAPDTRLYALMISIRSGNEREEKSQEHVLRQTNDHLTKPVAVCGRWGRWEGGTSWNPSYSWIPYTFGVCFEI